MEPIYFATAAEFRAWLEVNHDQVDVQWVGYFKKHTGIPSMTWPDSVDVALCFGWVDGLRHKVDGERYKIRFTPRRPRSTWSKINIDKMEALIAADLVHPAGLAAYAKRRADKSGIYGHEQDSSSLSPEFLERLQANELAWEYFSERLAPGYKKVTVHWVMRAKKAATRERRFGILLESCEEGRRIPLLRSPGKK